MSAMLGLLLLLHFAAASPTSTTLKEDLSAAVPSAQPSSLDSGVAAVERSEPPQPSNYKGFLGNLLRCVAALLGEPTTIITTSAAGAGVGGRIADQQPLKIAVVPPAGSSSPAVLIAVPARLARSDPPVGKGSPLRTFGGVPQGPEDGNGGPESAGRYYHCDFVPSVMYFLSNVPRLPAYRCVSGRIHALVASEDFRAPYGEYDWIEELDIQLSDDILSQVFPGSFHHVRQQQHRAVHGLEFKSPHVAINGLIVLQATT